MIYSQSLKYKGCPIKETMEHIQPPRGTFDILPGDSEQWQKLEAIIRLVMAKSGYREIRLPVFEHTDLFKRGVGDTTDIVNKEMYTFNDKSERSLTLRPEGTAGVVRAYLSNGLHRLPAPLKLWYMGPMFRYERTQTGRQRQFNQTGVEVLGSEGPAIDAEVLAVAADILQSAGVADMQLCLNSIGCESCRPVYRERLRVFLGDKLAHLCRDCQERYERNPLRMLDCKKETCQVHYVEAPEPVAHLCLACQEHWDGLRQALDVLGIAYKVAPRLVRGLDYYTRTVFEFVSSDSRLGVQSTVCAGGRYDYLVETLGGNRTAAVGWALGMERLLLLADDKQAFSPDVFCIANEPLVALQSAHLLRQNGLYAEMDFAPLGAQARSFGRQMQQANKIGARFCFIQGDDEVSAQTVTLKNMVSGCQETLPVKEAIENLRLQLGADNPMSVPAAGCAKTAKE